jgi:hypothetical protein
MHNQASPACGCRSCQTLAAMTTVSSEREFVSSVGLVITGASLEPHEVSDLLGLVPDSCWRKGDPKPVGESQYEWGGWKKRLPPRESGDPFLQELQQWVELLQPRASALKRLQESGLHVVLDCFVTINGAALVEIDCALQRRIAELSVPINMAIWAATNVG